MLFVLGHTKRSTKKKKREGLLGRGNNISSGSKLRYPRETEGTHIGEEIKGNVKYIAPFLPTLSRTAQYQISLSIVGNLAYIVSFMGITQEQGRFD